MFGLLWNTESDTLSAKKRELDAKANTKRKVLKCVAANFDPYNFNGPVFNRARLFLHKLQSQPAMGWDQAMSVEDCREWTNVCRQVNSVRSMSIPRFVGNRSGTYRLIAFTDSSKL